ncbi:MAG TPA: hypothetical protein VNX68_15080 [Nitrosopumilaceae archaeon]|jgi:hypothetical protein|nr:hypothetical protein [Nitrosopumilaceae archaeon]
MNNINAYSFDNVTVNLIQLMDEIYIAMNKLLYAINPGDLTDGYCDYDNQNLNITFYNDLTAEEIVSLNTTILSHVPNFNYGSLKFFKLNDSLDDPTKIDYDILGLKKNRIIIKGELRQANYYRSFDATAQTYSDLVVVEFRDYVRDSLGIVQYRNQTSNWICNDETTGLTKSFIKYYTDEEAIQEGIDRRNNLIAFAKTSLLSSLKAIVGEPANQSYAFDLLISVKLQMDYFSQGYTQPLKDAISASTKSYMGICQNNAITASTIVDSGTSQTDTVTINGVDFVYTSSSSPTQSEISNGIISLITGTTATSISNYVYVISTNTSSGVFNIKSKIPGWAFTLSASTNVLTSAVVANDNSIKSAIMQQLIF